MTNQNINQSQYNAMSIQGRTEYAWVYGSLLSSQNGRMVNFYLYQVAGFFVEMVFDRNKKKILSVYAFEDEQTLDKYLDESFLSQLYDKNQ